MLDVAGDVVVDRWWQSQVEEPVGLLASGQRQDVSVQFGEGALICILPTDVGVPAEEGRQTLCVCVLHLREEIIFSWED